MEGDFLSLPHYSALRKDAERNLEVGRFLSAAREFQALSLMAEKDGAYELAGEFAAKSGDCWLKIGRHATAATMYEQAAKHFHLAGKTSHAKSYFRKAFTEFLFASKVPEASNLDKAFFLVRAAKCVSALGDQNAAKTLFSKAYEILIASASSYFSNRDYASAVLHYLVFIKCCEELGDEDKARQINSFLRELSTRLISFISEKPVEERGRLVQDFFDSLFNNPLLKEVPGQLPVLFHTLLSVALESQRADIAQVLLNYLPPHFNPNSSPITVLSKESHFHQQPPAALTPTGSECNLNLPLLQGGMSPEKLATSRQSAKSGQFPLQFSTDGDLLDELKREEG